MTAEEQILADLKKVEAAGTQTVWNRPPIEPTSIAPVINNTTQTSAINPTTNTTTPTTKQQTVQAAGTTQEAGPTIDDWMKSGTQMSYDQWKGQQGSSYSYDKTKPGTFTTAPEGQYTVKAYDANNKVIYVRPGEYVPGASLTQKTASLNVDPREDIVDGALIQDKTDLKGLMGIKTGEPTLAPAIDSMTSKMSESEKVVADLRGQVQSMLNTQKEADMAQRDAAQKGLDTNLAVNPMDKYNQLWEKNNIESTVSSMEGIKNEFDTLYKTLYPSVTSGTNAQNRLGKARDIQAFNSQATALEARYNMTRGYVNDALSVMNTYYDKEMEQRQNNISAYQNMLNMYNDNVMDLTSKQVQNIDKFIEDNQRIIKEDATKQSTITNIIEKTDINTYNRAKILPTDTPEQMISKYNAATKEQQLVDALVAKYPETVKYSDNMQTAIKNLQNNPSYLKDQGLAGSDGQVLARAISLLNSGQANDIYEAIDMANSSILNEESAATVAEKNAIEAGKTGTTSQETKAALEETKVEALRLINELKNDPKLGKATGFDSFRANIPGTPEFNIKTKYDKLTSLLTLDNLKLLKGAMSDKDVAFLTSAATSLKLGLSEKDFIKELDNLASKFNNLTPVQNTQGVSEQEITNLRNSGKYTEEEIQQYVESQKQAFNQEGSVSNNAIKAATYKTTQALQCGEFVNKTVGIRVGQGKADKLANVNTYGVKGTNGIKQGDVIVQNIGDYGHVAVVTGFDEKGNIIVSESNYKKDGKVTHGRTVNPNSVYGYLKQNTNQLKIS